MNPTQQQQEKFQKLDELLRDEYCLIHLDSGIEGVQLPAHLLRRYQVTLQISRVFRGGLELTQEHVSTDLVFDGSYFTCVIPLPAIWGVSSAAGDNTLWPDSAPREVLAKILSESLRLEKGVAPELAPVIEAAPKKPVLTTVAAAPGGKAKKKRVAKKRKTPQLKLVKK